MHASARPSEGSIEAADGARIHWRARGDGPIVLVAPQILWSHPDVYSDLYEDLERDHRVVIYDARGCGESSRIGPYNAETDAGDILALLESIGPAEVAFAVGIGFNRVVRVAADRSDLIANV